MASPPIQPTPREVAFHEAGHIFAGKKLGRTFISSEIHPERFVGKGETIWGEEVTSTLVEGIVAAAGVCAEALCKNNSAPTQFPPSRNGGMSDDESLARKSAHRQTEHPGETKSVDELVEEYLVWAEDTCIAEGHWAIVEEIAKHLEETRRIVDSEVSAIFARHDVKVGL